MYSRQFNPMSEEIDPLEGRLWILHVAQHRTGIGNGQLSLGVLLNSLQATVNLQQSTEKLNYILNNFLEKLSSFLH